jgi:DUF1009 family protein
MNKQINNDKSRIALIAGNGNLPEKIILYFLKSKKDIFVILIGDTPPPPSIDKVPHAIINIGLIGKCLSTLRKENITDIVFAGGLQRPKIKTLRLDTAGVRLATKITTAKFIGDNSLLSLIIKFFETEGFNIIGVDKILPDILMPKGIIGKIKPNNTEIKDILAGSKIAKDIGNLDIGQSVIIQDGIIIGVEAIEGTDELIKRCGKLQRGGKGGILVKMKKPNQDDRIDLPTIGTKTIEYAHDNGLSGIAIEAESSIIIDQELVAKTADKLGIFVIGI